MGNREGEASPTCCRLPKVQRVRFFRRRIVRLEALTRRDGALEPLGRPKTRWILPRPGLVSGGAKRFRLIASG